MLTRLARMRQSIEIMEAVHTKIKGIGGERGEIALMSFNNGACVGPDGFVGGYSCGSVISFRRSHLPVWIDDNSGKEHRREQVIEALFNLFTK